MNSDDDLISRRVAEARDLLAAGRSREGTEALRSLPAQMRNRAAAVQATLRASYVDPDFKARVAEADAARDSQDFPRAEALYRRCLELYPFHYGYLTQFAHSVKEQRRFVEAEAHYRSALALGAPMGDVDEHIAFAAAMRDEPHVRHEPVPPAASPADEAATLEDVFLIHALFMHGPPGMDRALALLRASATRRGIMLHIVGSGEFLRANGALLTLLCERG